jgi:hypothetical protein
MPSAPRSLGSGSHRLLPASARVLNAIDCLHHGLQGHGADGPVGLSFAYMFFSPGKAITENDAGSKWKTESPQVPGQCTLNNISICFATVEQLLLHVDQLFRGTAARSMRLLDFEFFASAWNGKSVARLLQQAIH